MAHLTVDAISGKIRLHGTIIAYVYTGMQHRCIGGYTTYHGDGFWVLVKGRRRCRGKNGVYDCNRLGGRTTRVVLAVLPIIVELLYRRAFVETPCLSFSPPFSPLLSTVSGKKRYETDSERERSFLGVGCHQATTVGRYLSFLCVAKVPRPIGVELDGVFSWRFYLVLLFRGDSPRLEGWKWRRGGSGKDRRQRWGKTEEIRPVITWSTRSRRTVAFAPLFRFLSLSLFGFSSFNLRSASTCFFNLLFSPALSLLSFT